MFIPPIVSLQYRLTLIWGLLKSQFHEFVRTWNISEGTSVFITIINTLNTNSIIIKYRRIFNNILFYSTYISMTSDSISGLSAMCTQSFKYFSEYDFMEEIRGPGPFQAVLGRPRQEKG